MCPELNTPFLPEQVWRPPPRRGRPQPGEHPARAGGLHAEANLDQGRPRGGLLDGHRAVRHGTWDLKTFPDDDDGGR